MSRYTLMFWLSWSRSFLPYKHLYSGVEWFFPPSRLSTETETQETGRCRVMKKRAPYFYFWRNIVVFKLLNYLFVFSYLFVYFVLFVCYFFLQNLILALRLNIAKLLHRQTYSKSVIPNFRDPKVVLFCRYSASRCWGNWTLPVELVKGRYWNSIERLYHNQVEIVIKNSN